MGCKSHNISGHCEFPCVWITLSVLSVDNTQESACHWSLCCNVILWILVHLFQCHYFISIWKKFKYFPMFPSSLNSLSKNKKPIQYLTQNFLLLNELVFLVLSAHVVLQCISWCQNNFYWFCDSIFFHSPLISI